MTQEARNSTIAITNTSSLISRELFRPVKRTQFIIINTDAAATVSIQKGYGAAVANQGIVLGPNGVYTESTDSGFQCWQGPISAVSSAANQNISVVETIDDGQ